MARVPDSIPNRAARPDVTAQSRLGVREINALEAILQLDLARAYDRVGDLQDGFQGANLADTEAALRSYVRALSIRNAVWNAGHPDPAVTA